MTNVTTVEAADDKRRGNTQAVYIAESLETEQLRERVDELVQYTDDVATVFDPSPRLTTRPSTASSPDGPTELSVLLALMDDGEFDEVMFSSWDMFGDLNELYQFLSGYVVDQRITIRFEPMPDLPFEIPTTEGAKRWKSFMTAVRIYNNLDMQQRRKEIAQRITAVREFDYHTGRPPLGFDSENGELVRLNRHRDICATLQMVDTGEVSKAAAAREPDCSRKAITRILQNRRNMYRLN
ncbi:MAG: hypothetical protein J07HX5_00934 [halophilic archaeon J07HX5]|nr:MAG: hypothetical protein J07HX5_00934 [halophilic archaeon J07HX5]